MENKDLIQFIDFTTLNATDTVKEVNEFIEKAKSVSLNGKFVAGLCCFSNFAALLNRELKDTSIKSVVVAGAFPHGQSPIEAKVAEVEIAASANVDEIDIVISRSFILSNDFDSAGLEILKMKEVTGNAKLKVILETGEINEGEVLREACQVAMRNGADFLKTSTGKISEGATIPKFKIMCEEISNYYQETGKRIGIKASGGIRTAEDAMNYYNTVKSILGNDWLNSNNFRIGASSLLDNHK